MSINENLLNEKINQLKKGLEIIGADKKLYSKSNSDIINNNIFTSHLWTKISGYVIICLPTINYVYVTSIFSENDKLGFATLNYHLRRK